MKKPLPVVDTHKKMVEEFQCPGCVAGSDVTCGAFKLEDSEGMFRCLGHCAGTNLVKPGLGLVTLILGLPNGFNRLGPQARSETPKMRMWTRGHHPEWNKMIEVIEDGTIDMCPGAINVGEFYDEID